MALCGNVNSPAWRVPQASSCELTGLDQVFSDPLRLAIRADRDRPEEPDAAPLSGKIGPDQFAVHLRGKTGDVFSREPAVDIVEVGPEIFRVGSAEKRAEGGAEDAPGCRQIVIGQRSNYGAQLSLLMIPRMAGSADPATRGAPPGATPRPAC